MWKKKQWQILPEVDESVLIGLSNFSPIIARLLANRGLVEEKSARAFLHLDDDFVAHDPFLFRDMAEACQLIINHIKSGHKIAIAGDYDADGITSSAVMFDTLTILKGQAEVWIPSRLIDGYGLNRRLVKEIADSGAKLIITVDNGIRSSQELAYAKSLGLDLLVTDHHTVSLDSEALPDSLILNPIVEAETYPWRYLAGVGVAYKLASALISMAKINDESKEILRRRVVDLVAIGTVADCVSLLDENRHLVREGLDELNRHPRPGISALVKVAQVKGRINEWHIGWQIAPRLNVAGRLAHANTAYELLVTRDEGRAMELALQLNEQNQIRQAETERIVDYCQQVVESKLMDDNILVLTAPDIDDSSSEAWFEGVIGLVAGRLAERYHKPCLVICNSEGKLKGSGRSVADYSIIGALEESKQYLERFGGHRAACGFSIKDKESLALFVTAVRQIGQRDLTKELLAPKLRIEMVLELSQLTKDLAESLMVFSPFGQGNPMPIFASYGLVIRDCLTMGLEAQHIKFRIGTIWAISFGGSQRWQGFTIGDKVDLAYTIELNEFNGVKNVQIKIVDMVLNT